MPDGERHMKNWQTFCIHKKETNMGYFPFFVELKDKKGLIVGGDKQAAEKIEKLLPFAPKLTIVSTLILPKLLEDKRLTCIEREFSDSDIEDVYFVIAATHDTDLNLHISRLCQKKGILVNVVDDKEKCCFLFPALIKQGALTIGISTEGASPQIAVTLRNRIASVLPRNIDEILDYLANVRVLAKNLIGNSQERVTFLKEVAGYCLENACVLTEEELLFWAEQHQSKQIDTD